MGQRCDYFSTPKPSPPADASRRLAEGLLGAEMTKRGTSLLIRFSALSDSNAVHRTLVQMRDGYKPER